MFYLFPTNIIVAMLKYQFRYLIMNDNELVSQAFLSQAKLTRNSSNTMTYTYTAYTGVSVFKDFSWC